MNATSTRTAGQVGVRDTPLFSPVQAQPDEVSHLLCSVKTLGLGDTSDTEKKPSLERWKSDVATWEERLVLREFLWTTGLTSLEGSCVETAGLWRHKTTNELQLRPHACQNRAYCPHCAVNYGLERGLERKSLYDALFEPGHLLDRMPTIRAFAHVLTLPESVSKHLDNLLEQGRVNALRAALKDLTSAVHRCLSWWYGSDGIATSLAWHWWHTSNVLEGPHWHAHVMVPNISIDPSGTARVLRHRGKLDPVELVKLRERWALEVAKCRFVLEAALEIPSELTTHYKFLQQNKLSHRSRYDLRHPMQDLTKVLKSSVLPSVSKKSHSSYNDSGECLLDPFNDSEERLFDDSDLPGLAWFLGRVGQLQRVQLVRYTGWLTNSKRKKLGLVREEPGENEWRNTGEYYTFTSFTDEGVNVEHWKGGWKVSRFFPRKEVSLFPSPRHRRYAWAAPPA